MEFIPRNNCFSPSALGYAWDVTWCGLGSRDFCFAWSLLCVRVICDLSRVNAVQFLNRAKRACGTDHVRGGGEAVLAEVQHCEIRQVTARVMRAVGQGRRCSDAVIQVWSGFRHQQPSPYRRPMGVSLSWLQSTCDMNARV